MSNNSYTLEGRMHAKYDTVRRSDSFQSREFVIEVLGAYPEFVKMQFTQLFCSLLDGVDLGEMVSIKFSIKGREWQGKYLTNLNAWSIMKKVPEAAPNPAPVQTAPKNDYANWIPDAPKINEAPLSTDIDRHGLGLNSPDNNVNAPAQVMQSFSPDSELPQVTPANQVNSDGKDLPF